MEMVMKIILENLSELKLDSSLFLYKYNHPNRQHHSIFVSSVNFSLLILSLMNLYYIK